MLIKIRRLVVTLMCVMLLSVAAYAAGGAASTQVVMTIGSTTATQFGKIVQNDVAPIIINDRTMLPARFVAESLGAEVRWDALTRSATIVKGNRSIVLTIDSDTATVDGHRVKLDSPAVIRQNRTYTPVRFIAEALGASVTWVAEQRQVVLDTEGYVATAVSEVQHINYGAQGVDVTADNNIFLPKLTKNSADAAAFNAKILAAYAERNAWMVYDISYQYSVFDGLVGIIITKISGPAGGGAKTEYAGYYYDTKADKELTKDAYLQAFGIRYDKLLAEINGMPDGPSMYGMSLVVREESQILAAAYDGGALSLACESEDGWSAAFVLGRYAK